MPSQLDDLVEQASGIVFPYSETYAAAHTVFAEKMWPHKHRRRDPAYNRWKFRGPEHGPVDGLLLAVLNGRVVGQLGLIPVILRAAGKDYPAQWACDLMVDTSLRRKRLGSLLLAVGMTRPMVTLGSNPSPSADAVMTSLGFQPLRGPHSMFLPLEPASSIRARLPERYHPIAPILARLVKPAIAWRTRELLTPGFQNLVPNVPWISVADQILCQEIQLPHIVHDYSFLTWRCQGLTGYSPVLSALSTNDGAFALIQSTPSNFYVYEWCAKSFEDTRVLFNRVVNLATVQHSQTIVVLANSGQERGWLSRLGFFTSRFPVKVIFYPPEPLQNFNNFYYRHDDSDGNL